MSRYDIAVVLVVALVIVALLVILLLILAQGGLNMVTLTPSGKGIV